MVCKSRDMNVLWQGKKKGKNEVVCVLIANTYRKGFVRHFIAVVYPGTVRICSDRK